MPGDSVERFQLTLMMYLSENSLLTKPDEQAEIFCPNPQVFRLNNLIYPFQPTNRKEKNDNREIVISEQGLDAAEHSNRRDYFHNFPIVIFLFSSVC